MCVFSFDPRTFPAAKPVEVTSTRIFARGLADGRQILVYSMRYSSEVDVAMILPLPTPGSSPEDAVFFIDISGYGSFFQEMESGFPPEPVEQYEGLALSAMGTGDGSQRILAVHDVGSFEASFVPTQEDFSRLDPRFRLPEGVLDRLPMYRDYGFAVFKLKPGRLEPHPMAFHFPRRNAGELYFPTVHVHDGTVPEKAKFDHLLYCQPAPSSADGWEISRTWRRPSWHELAPEGRELTSDEKLAIKLSGLERPYARHTAVAKAFMKIDRTKGTVAADLPVGKLTIRGQLKNADIVVPQAA
jgi:hypothetical protein